MNHYQMINSLYLQEGSFYIPLILYPSASLMGGMWLGTCARYVYLSLGMNELIIECYKKYET